MPRRWSRRCGGCGVLRFCSAACEASVAARHRGSCECAALLAIAEHEKESQAPVVGWGGAYNMLAQALRLLADRHTHTHIEAVDGCVTSVDGDVASVDGDGTSVDGCVASVDVASVDGHSAVDGHTTSGTSPAACGTAPVASGTSPVASGTAPVSCDTAAVACGVVSYDDCRTRLLGNARRSWPPISLVQQAADAALAFVPIDARVPRDELCELLNRQQANVFGVRSPCGNDVARACFVHAMHCFNHSCVPNVVFDPTPVTPRGRAAGDAHRDPLMSLVAIDDIPEGAELTLAYTCVDDEGEERRAHLLEVYGFECICPRCVEEQKGA
jgi:hypothetical protein